MNTRFDAAVWAGLERRLAEVERFVPEVPPPWASLADTTVVGAVRAGPLLGRAGSRPASRRRQVLLALTVVSALLALIAAAMLVGSPRPSPVIDRRDDPFGPFGIHRPSDPRGSIAVLPDGRVLIASGTWRNMGTQVGRDMDLWDPLRGRTWAAYAVAGRVAPTATLLLDGSVLVTGGFGGPYAYASSAVASAETWSPLTGQFSPTGSMAVPRVLHTATLLPDGGVLVVGGQSPDGPVLSAEIWEPRSGTFRPAGESTSSGGTATLLPTGDVLRLGPEGAEIWTAASATFALIGGLPDDGAFAGATQLLDGRVLVFQDSPEGDRRNPSRAFITTDGRSFTSVGSMLHARTRYATTVLPDGRVLITGGVTREQGPATSVVEVFDPADQSFREAPRLARAVDGHAAVLLPDGRVLVVFNVIGLDYGAEPFIYDPPPGPTR